MKLIVLAAGKGTRFLPLTKMVPKGMIEIEGRPLLEWVLKPFISSISSITIIVSLELGEKIKTYFGTSFENVPVTYVTQGAFGKGTFYSLSCAEHEINQSALSQDELFCVCNCDDLFAENDIQNAVAQRVPGIGVSKSQMPWNYLGIDIDRSIEKKMIKGFRRHGESTSLVTDTFSNGFHILSKEVLMFTPQLTKDGESGLPQTLFANLSQYPLGAFDFTNWQAVNGPEDLAAATLYIKKHRGTML